jgi:hypothetical protein
LKENYHSQNPVFFFEDMKSIPANDYVVKSFDLTELKSKIARALNPDASA